MSPLLATLLLILISWLTTAVPSVYADALNFTLYPFSVAGVCSRDPIERIAYQVATDARPGLDRVWVMGRADFELVTRAPRPPTRVNETYGTRSFQVYAEVSCGGSAGNITECRRDSGEASIGTSGSADRRLCVAVMRGNGRWDMTVSVNTSFTIDWALAGLTDGGTAQLSGATSMADLIAATTITTGSLTVGLTMVTLLFGMVWL